MTRILLAGDRFVTPDLFRRALLSPGDGDAPPIDAAMLDELELAWPQVPFGSVDGVDEASGTPDELLASLGDAEICVTQLAPFSRRVIASSPHLRMIGVCRGGPVNVDLDAATEHGVLVTFAPGRNAQAAAEFALALMLAAMRKVSFTDAELKAQRWRGDQYALDSVGDELGGATVGLVGYGAIGSIVARVLRAFGAHVLVHDPYADPAAMQADGVESVDLPSLMRRSRVVSLHARLTEETRHIVDEEMLALLPRGAVVVNSARGGLLDYAPLPRLLQDGHLGALALDVYDIEPPPPDWPLFSAPNVVTTPHLGGATRQTAERAASIVAADVHAFLAGRQPAHVANPAVLGRFDLAVSA